MAGSNLIAIKFHSLEDAEKAFSRIADLEQKHLLELDDVAMVIRQQNGKVKLRQTADITAGKGALSGGFWGLLIGMIFLVPLAGGLLGAALGALAGSATDLGISDEFMKKVGQEIQPGDTAIFALIRQATYDKVVDELKDLDGELYYTSLSADEEAKLRKALTPKE